ncbi:MAG: F0F1 ATP synthase subunit A [Candidatus Gracilibacteria bacterium]|nr:F0F1 ATP synthase subunit A [Candidatus Gracilibacteria bacterium]MDQ7022063.1 F0F1 ATP synthase subunit A [Candidatus Gracilibacteria bacterium]
MQDFLQKSFGEIINISWQASFMGIIIELFIIGIIVLLYRFFPKNAVFVFFEMAFEAVYNFFEELLGKKEKIWLKTYVTILFFIILISNLLGVLLEFLIPVFGHGLEHYIKIPTADINFNIAMAIIGVLIVVSEQFKSLGLLKFFHEYFPILGKNYIPYERGSLPKAVDFIVYLIVKLFDIIISLFLGVLEIIGLFAKIISLSFRLFGNITSGGVLLVMLFGAMSALTVNLLSIDLPLFVPLIVYLQEILVSFIQAFVFPLLIAIFVKVAKLH